ncbi:Phosphoglyceromutase [Chlamydia abortus]|uniref:Histidine phosphatase family protein n=1 Tax=Paenibacillus residui TaxID=629724 RepID=A0ABW3D504_9BACL|nr:histidine phosphatase family protein [Paenibacillus sp. 32O-W]SHE14767.1 Phosphoglyceromutase [Chlamydia abortus]
MKTTIYMVRHAKAPYIFGQEQTRGLSEEGLAAARKVADILAEVEVDYIISSNYRRAVQTVQNLAERKGLPVIEFDQLRERAIIGLEYEAEWEDLLKAIEKSFADPDFALEGGESTREAQQRAIPVIEELLNDHRGQNIVVGTHGNIMTIIMNYYNKEFGFDFWRSISMPDIYKLTFTGNRLESVERVWEVI